MGVSSPRKHSPRSQDNTWTNRGSKYNGKRGETGKAQEQSGRLGTSFPVINTTSQRQWHGRAAQCCHQLWAVTSTDLSTRNRIHILFKGTGHQPKDYVLCQQNKAWQCKDLNCTKYAPRPYTIHSTENKVRSQTMIYNTENNKRKTRKSQNTCKLNNSK